jgi:hypothetical protein
MISNTEVAKQVSQLMHDVLRRLDESVEMVKNSCSQDEAASYRKAVGMVPYPILDVLEPLYKQNPDLKPPNWHGKLPA